MKRKIATNILATIVFLCAVFGMSAPVFAADTDYNPFGTLCQADRADTEMCKELQRADQDAKSSRGVLGPDGIITRATQLIVFLSGAIAVVMIIMGGLQYVLSGGNPGKDGVGGIAGAKNTVLYAMIGLAVALVSQVIVSFVLSKL